MQDKKKYKNIIFDFGGVLVTFNVKEILQDLFKDEEVMSVEQWHEVFHCEPFEKLQRGELSGSQAIDALPEKYNKDQVRTFFTNIAKYLHPIEKIINLLQILKEKPYKIYMLSNNASGLLDSSQYDYDFLELFDGIVLSHDVGVIKPYPEIYNILLEKYSLKPEECLFIDDFERNVEGAKDVGIDGVLCSDPDTLIADLVALGVLTKEEAASL